MKPNWMLPDIETLTELPVSQIAMQLHRLKRYGGAIDFSVLQHSLLVYRLARSDDPVTLLWALLHDVGECWIGDALKPAKQIAGHAWSDLEQHYDKHVQRLAGITVSLAVAQRVRDADQRACEIEMMYWNAYPFAIQNEPLRKAALAQEIDWINSVDLFLKEIK